MGDYTRAVFGQLEQGQAAFVQSFNGLQDTVSTLDGQLQASLAAWDGAAQAAYHQAKATWNAAMADMANTLNALGQVIGTANENYSGAESANAAMWQ